MVEIPEDITLAAEGCFRNMRWSAELKTGPDDEDFVIAEDELKARVARAILGERQRCADVARHLNGWGADCGRGGHAEHIASAILSPT